MYEEIQQYASLGFSFVMCGWFMFRMEQALQKNTDAFTMLSGIIQKCKKPEAG